MSIVSDLVAKIDAGFVALANKVQTLANRTGNPANLTTSAKGDLVAAINEVQASAAAAAATGGAAINDSNTSTSTTWSSSKSQSAINAAVAPLTTKADMDSRFASLVGAAPAALDTLAELATALQSEQSLSTSFTNSLADRVAYSSQTKTETEKTKARANIGAVSSADIGNASTANFTATVNTIVTAV